MSGNIIAYSHNCVVTLDCDYCVKCSSPVYTVAIARGFR